MPQGGYNAGGVELVNKSNVFCKQIENWEPVDFERVSSSWR